MMKTENGLLLAAFVCLAACADGAQSLVILQNQVPADGCVLQGGEQDQFQAAGVIDVASTLGYQLYPVIMNRAITRPGDDDTRRAVFVEGADIRLEVDEGLIDANTQESLRKDGVLEFTELFSALVGPDGGTATVSLTVVPVELLQMLSASVGQNSTTVVRAEVTIFGDFGGGDIESVPFSYPVTLCSGQNCVIRDVGSCDLLPDGFEPAVGHPCNFFQDGPIDCCTSAGGGVLCGSQISGG